MPKNENSGLLAGIAGALPVVGGVFNAISQGVQNRKAREFSEKMYGVQRKDALADFNMTNFYNSPAEQMARLKAAGLNPNLVYGTGTVANNASGVRSSSAPGWSPTAPKVDMGGAVQQGLQAYTSTNMMQLQIENLRKNNELLDAEKIKKFLESIQINQSTKSSEFKLDLDKTLRANTIATAEAGLGKIGAETRSIDQGIKKSIVETDVHLNDMRIKNLMLQPNIEKVLTEIVDLKASALLKDAQRKQVPEATEKIKTETLHIKTQIRNALLEGNLKEFELRIRNQRGLSHDYPGYLKAITDLLRHITNSSVVDIEGK